MKRKVTIDVEIDFDSDSCTMPDFNRRKSGLDFFAAGLAALGHKGLFSANGQIKVTEQPECEASDK